MANTEFHPLNFYRQATKYKFLPFRFKRLKNDLVVLTNIVGQHIFLNDSDFALFSQKKLTSLNSNYRRLKSLHFLYDSDSDIHTNILSSKLWTKKSFISGFTKLHIFVLSLRCNSSCSYCQASRQNVDAGSQYDMTIETARKSVELMMKSPSPEITVEFQGGEPMLNFDALKEIVLYSKELNQKVGKQLSYVVCTNLSILSQEHLDFFKAHKVSISTSIDGPAELHDKNRASKYPDAKHAVVERNIRRAQEALGFSAVSALMTTTRSSLKYSKEIVDEYIRLNLGSIFLRSLNPYGFAVKTEKAIGYSSQEFFKFYRDSLDYILHLNRQGTMFTEAFTALLARKILTPWTIGFVDLQSPTGNGFAVTVYNFDGDVYASDESRMLAEMGDQTFRLGNVFEDTYEEIYFGDAMQLIASAGVAECISGCSDCAYVPFCGADPIRHYATQKDVIGHRPTSSFCGKYQLIFDYLFERLSKRDVVFEETLWSWLRCCDRDDVILK